jgi:hypothetical protein
VASLGVDLIVAGSAVRDGGEAEKSARFVLEAARSARAGEEVQLASSSRTPVTGGVDSRKEE